MRRRSTLPVAVRSLLLVLTPCASCPLPDAAAVRPSDEWVPSSVDSTTARPDTLRVYELPEEIVVSAARLPVPLHDLASSATILTGDAIGGGTAGTLPALLAGKAGLHVFDVTGNGVDVAAESRGFTGFGQTSHLRFLVNGVPFNDLADDNAVLNLFDLEQLDRVEVVRSSASTLFGNTSFTGVVDLVPRAARSARSVWGRLGGGSDGRTFGALGAGWRGARGNGAGSVSWRKTDGFRDHSDSGASTAYGLASWSAAPLADVGIDLVLHRSESEVPGALDAAALDARREAASTPLDDDETERLYAVSSIDLRSEAGDRLRAGLYTQLENKRARQTILDTEELDREARTFGFTATYHRRVSVGGTAGGVLAGAEGSIGDLSASYRAVSPEGAAGSPLADGEVDRDDLAGFVRADWRPTPAVTVSAGVRYDSVRGELAEASRGDAGPASDEDHRRRKIMTAWSPSASVNWRWEASSNAYVEINRSFKTPTLTQLYDLRPYFIDPDGPGGEPPIRLEISNDGLEPQRATQIEVGVRTHAGDRVAFDVAAYEMRARDEIGFDLGTFRYANLIESTHRGVEANVSWNPWSTLWLRPGYTFTRARFDTDYADEDEDLAGNQINNVPKHIGRLGLSHDDGGFGVDVTATLVWDQYADEGNHVRIPDYQVVDCRVGRRLGEHEVYAVVSNVLDETYSSAGYIGPDAQGRPVPLFYPAPGRRVEVGVRFGFR
jgi:outer membrane receptor protein involved in Fe transport